MLAALLSFIKKLGLGAKSGLRKSGAVIMLNILKAFRAYLSPKIILVLWLGT